MATRIAFSVHGPFYATCEPDRTCVHARGNGDDNTLTHPYARPNKREYICKPRSLVLSLSLFFSLRVTSSKYFGRCRRIMAPGFSSAKRKEKNMQTCMNPRMKIWRCGDCVDVANIWHYKKGKKGINKGREGRGDTR